MCRFVKRLFVWAIAMVVLMVASPDEARSDADEAKRLIVMINGEIQGRQAIGAGIIIGWGADRLYIATANHVVRQGPNKLQEVRVRLKFLPGQEIEAEVLSDFDPDLDLAVLSVTGVQALAIPLEVIPFQLLGPAAGLKRGDEVFTIGYPRGKRWQVNVSPDLIAETIGDDLTFESQLVANGHSGGGLFDRDWNLVGMITADQPPNGVAIRIDRVLEQMKLWDYPVKLTPPPAQDAAAAAIVVAEIDDTYYALKNGNLRSGPGTSFDKVGRLTVGQEVEVTGKVQDKAWLRIALQGGKEAFVYAPLLSPEKPKPAETQVAVGVNSSGESLRPGARRAEPQIVWTDICAEKGTIKWWNLDAQRCASREQANSDSDFWFKHSNRGQDADFCVDSKNGAKYAPLQGDHFPWEVLPGQFVVGGCTVPQGSLIPCITSQGYPCQFKVQLNQPGRGGWTWTMTFIRYEKK